MVVQSCLWFQTELSNLQDKTKHLSLLDMFMQISTEGQELNLIC